MSLDFKKKESNNSVILSKKFGHQLINSYIDFREVALKGNAKNHDLSFLITKYDFRIFYGLFLVWKNTENEFSKRIAQKRLDISTFIGVATNEIDYIDTSCLNEIDRVVSDNVDLQNITSKLMKKFFNQPIDFPNPHEVSYDLKRSFTFEDMNIPVSWSK